MSLPKIKYFLAFVFLIIFIVTDSFAIKDTLKAELPEIKVKADRILSNSSLQFSPVSVITNEEITKSGSWQVSDAISRTPGVFVKNYGGLGGLKTVSLRGASSSQTLVLLDGMRINSSRNGTIDLSIIPLTFLDEIEIVRGGVSTLYGGSALSGVVNLRVSNSKKNELKVLLNYGSFNSTRASVKAGFGSESWKFTVGGEYVNSDGDYSFKSNQFGDTLSFKRQNADFQNLAIIASAFCEFEESSLSSTVILRNTDRGTPGAVLQGQIESRNSRLVENEGLISIKWRKLLDEQSNLSFSALGKFNRDLFNNPDILKGLESEIESRDLAIKITYKHEFPWLKGSYSIDGAYSDLTSDYKTDQAEQFKTRRSISFSAIQETYGYKSIGQDFKLNFGLRTDYYSSFQPFYSPLVGFLSEFDVIPLIYKFSWSYNFRPPSFNELYYFNYGNPELKPEKGHNINFAIAFNPFEIVKLDLAIFLSDIEDQIVSVPKSITSWTAENYGEVFTRGVELTLSGSIFEESLVYSANYTWQLATDNYKTSETYKKKIPYMPEELANFLLSYKYSKFQVGSNLSYTGFRFALPGNNIESKLSSFMLANIHIIYMFTAFSSEFSVRLDANNIFDEQYKIIKNYPMPGRYYRVGCSYNFDGF